MQDPPGLYLPRIREELAEKGYSYVDDLSDGLDYAAELTRIGPLIPQYAGELVRDIKPDPAFRDDITSPYNTSEVTPHTEWYEFSDLPPRYVALWCVSPADGPGGETTLADGYRIVDLFGPVQRQQMFITIQEWTSHVLKGDHVGRHPILATHSGNLVLRFSTNDLRRNTDLSARYIDSGVQFFRAHNVALKIERGAILIWDNWRMLHARNSFTDRRRHLRRVLIGVQAGLSHKA
jgi:alpha-ketoglutarate-dependent taurine dioxygenase